MIWTNCFKLMQVLLGRIVTARFGTLDFADPNLPMEKVQALFEDDSPYLQITPLGIDTLYPVPLLAKLKPKELVPPVRKIRKRKAM
jgi:hypothetical protein